MLWYPPVDLLASHHWLAATPGCVGKTEDPVAAVRSMPKMLVVMKGSGHYPGFDAGAAAPAALEFLQRTIGGAGATS